MKRTIWNLDGKFAETVRESSERNETMRVRRGNWSSEKENWKEVKEGEKEIL